MRTSDSDGAALPIAVAATSSADAAEGPLRLWMQEPRAPARVALAS